jgi:hypothetical protein
LIRRPGFRDLCTSRAIIKYFNAVADLSDLNDSTKMVAKKIIFNEGSMVADEINYTNYCSNIFNCMDFSAIPILVTEYEKHND